MGETTESAAGPGDRSLRQGVAWWTLVEGNRLLVAGAMVFAFSLALAGALRAGAVTVGYESNVRRLLASGMAAGLLSLITVTLSINQLILSRVFGAPGELVDQFDGTVSLQRTVEDHIDSAVAPGEPAALLASIAEAIDEEASSLSGETDDLDDFVRRLREYGEATESFDEGGGTTAVLATTLTTSYASEFNRTRELLQVRENSPTVETRLNAIRDLLRAMAALRQYLKTIVIQQEFAQLSRLIAYTGVAGLAVALSLAMVYETSTGAVLPRDWLPIVATGGFAVMLTPLAVLVSYVLRAATIARYTVSAGPIVPPEETFGE
jgi:hypothetical protein